MTTGSLPARLDTPKAEDRNAVARPAPALPPDAGDWLADAQRYLRSVRRHKWLVLSLTLFATAAGIELSVYALPPNYAARATVWIQVPAHQARDEGPIWSGHLPISSGWIDLIRTNIVLEEVARRERLYLVNVSGDSAALTSFAIKERVRPGTYLLAVDTVGTGFTLTGDAGAVLEPGASAAILLYENRWARPFAEAVKATGAQLVARGAIPGADLVEHAESLETANA